LGPPNYTHTTKEKPRLSCSSAESQCGAIKIIIECAADDFEVSSFVIPAEHTSTPQHLTLPLNFRTIFRHWVLLEINGGNLRKTSEEFAATHLFSLLNFLFMPFDRFQTL